jgi:hypothetical protein
MIFKILDKRKEENKSCFLGKTSLYEYVINLPDNYRDYEVQREIVSNSYLDNLIETILLKKHIPPIVLVIESGDYSISDKGLDVSKFKILDGLQRTFRLKLIWDTINLLEKELQTDDSLLKYSKFKLSRTYSDKLLNINSSTNILSRLIEFHKENKDFELMDLYRNNLQWFEIWTDLSPDEEVQKMLVLNAGHKPVKTKHQLELLFRNLLPIIKKTKNQDFELIREKQQSAISYSKKREKGQFHFSHLISSILSLKEGKTITTNVGLIQKTQSSDFEIEEFNMYFNYGFFELFIELLMEIDNKVSNKFGDLGLKWVGREVSLVGIFAAAGKYAFENSLSPRDTLKLIKSRIVINIDHFQLDEFERLRNNLELSKVNIGSVNKKAITGAMYDLISGDTNTINWSKYFKA